jgi:hypothetical protein
MVEGAQQGAGCCVELYDEARIGSKLEHTY